MACGWHTGEAQCVADCIAFRSVVPEEAFLAAVTFEGFGCLDERHSCNVRDCAQFCDGKPPSCKGDCVDACATHKRRATEVCTVEVSTMLECFLEEPGACESLGDDGAPCRDEVIAVSVCAND